MNILILNKNNPTKESGVVALDLFNQLKSKGHEVKLLVNSFDKAYPEGIISLETLFSIRKKLFLAKLEWRVNKLIKLGKNKEKLPVNPDYCFFQIDEGQQLYKTRKLLKVAHNKPDIIIVLWVKNFVNLKNIYELHELTHAKIFWLLYDMAPFTGGCHYAWECKGYQNSCGSCPGLFSKDPFDMSNKNLSFKKHYLDKIDLEIIAGSEWQYLQAKTSTLFKAKRIHKILIPIDPVVFKPVTKEAVRNGMNLPENKKIIFFGAVGLTERRKGMYFLIESLNRLKELMKSSDNELSDNILLLIAGQEFDAITDSLPFDFKYLGYLNSGIQLAEAYQAADVFVCPSIEDSGPMMINQSIMSGTPVVSFNMGVSVDLVRTGETGYLAELKDSNDMAFGIYSILKLTQDDYTKMSIKCREIAMQTFSPQIRIELLDSLLKNQCQEG